MSSEICDQPDDHREEKLKPREDQDHRPNAFLSVPECETVLRTPDNKPIELERLIQILGRALLRDGNCKVEAWVKFLPPEPF
ncbi:MAG TPA: hypothetical protein VIQ31_16555 [Phormidium sp.]